jgi:taurine dioxygenase
MSRDFFGEDVGMALTVVPSGGALGADVLGVDLRHPIDLVSFETIRAALYRHEVICLRGSEIDDEDQIRFSGRFGRLRKLNVSQFLHRTKPEILVVSNVVEEGKHIGSYDAGILWHTDGAYLEVPHAISALRAVELPQRDGRVLGDTLFASTSAAYDALPLSMKRRIDGLQALNSVVHRHAKTVQAGIKTDLMSEAIKREPEAVHPVVRVHPVTGRKCLYVTEGFTVRILGLPEDEGRDLLSELVAHCTRPEFIYRHQWQLHDLVMWDDCSTQHKATFDYALPLRRRMHRTTIVDATQ